MKNQLLGKVDMVLDAIIYAEQPPTLQQLAERLSMPVATIGRITSDLVEMNFLEKIDYHTFAPAPAMARFGYAAQNSVLLQKAVPLIKNFIEPSGMSAVMVMFDRGRISRIYTGGSNVSPLFVRRSGVEVMALAASGIPVKEALNILSGKYKNTGDTERLLWEQELFQAGAAGSLLRVKTIREFSFALPFHFKEKLYALAVYGTASEGYTQERFCFDCSLLVSRIVSA